MVVNSSVKIGYALGGGGARGLAHIGVLKVLEEHGIRPDIVAGTSMGSIVGALYSGGLTPGEIEKLALGLDWKKLVNLVDVTLPISGLLKGNRVVSLLRSIMGDMTFSQLKCDFASVATNIINGEQVVLRDGSLIEAIRASISIPGIFTPVAVEGRYLVDGGLINTVPVSVCRDMGAEYVIGVNVIPRPGQAICNPAKEQQYEACEMPESDETGHGSGSGTSPATHGVSLRSRVEEIETAVRVFFMSHRQRDDKGKLKQTLKPKREKVPRTRSGSPRLADVLSQSLTITEYWLAVENLKGADLAISPDVGHVGFWQFNRAAEAIAAGEQAARLVLETNKLPVLSR
jgi:NTE family protein